MITADSLRKKAAEYDDVAAEVAESGDLAEENYYQGIADGVRLVANWLIADYNDHPPLT